MSVFTSCESPLLWLCEGLFSLTTVSTNFDSTFIWHSKQLTKVSYFFLNSLCFLCVPEVCLSGGVLENLFFNPGALADLRFLEELFLSWSLPKFCSFPFVSFSLLLRSLPHSRLTCCLLITTSIIHLWPFHESFSIDFLHCFNKRFLLIVEPL